MFEYSIPLSANYEINLGQIMLAILLVFITRYILNKVKDLANKAQHEGSLLPKTLRYARIAIICLSTILLIQIFKIDDILDGLQGNEQTVFKVSNLLWVFLVFLIARLADNFLTEFLNAKNSSTDNVSGVQYFVWLLLGGLILSKTDFNVNINPIADSNPILLSNILWALAALFAAHIISSIIIHVLLSRYYRVKMIDVGAQYALNTLLKYFVYVIATIIAIQNLGFDANAIWGALAGAAIVIGLGIQQVVNDFASGILLLFERSIVVGNVIDVDGHIGKVKKIGIRASIIETRDDTNLIIPNSHLVSNNVVNWNFARSRVKFSIPVGVAYGSDTKLVESILLKAVAEDKSILPKPAPFVWFKSFDDSSLLFELHYWSTQLMEAEATKSKIRYRIDELFRASNIEIPFPQRVVHVQK